MSSSRALDDHPLLMARHVDSLTEAVHALTRNVSQLSELTRKQLQATLELIRILGATSTPQGHATPATVVSIGHAPKLATVSPARRKGPR